ncbi:MAG: tyrosine-type recombinase/integrase [Planctomycetota bacterium]
MRVRQQENHGNSRWVVDYEDGRGKRHQKFFAKRSEASAFASTITAKRSRPGPTLLIDDLFDAYVYATKPTRTKDSQYHTRRVAARVLGALDAVGVRYAHGIKPTTFGEVVALLEAQDLSEWTVTAYMGVYRACMRWAIRRGYVSGDDVGDMKLRTPQSTRERYLSKPEIGTLLSWLANHERWGWLHRPVALGIYQGLRRSEICQLTGGNIDLAQNSLTVGGAGQRTKNRKWRVIQLHPKARAVLPVPLPTNGSPLCTTATGAELSPHWFTVGMCRARKALPRQFDDVTPHTLRHTCASQMALSGNYTLYEIKTFLGHSSVKVTEKYAHLMPGQVQPNW